MFKRYYFFTLKAMNCVLTQSFAKELNFLGSQITNICLAHYKLGQQPYYLASSTIPNNQYLKTNQVYESKHGKHLSITEIIRNIMTSPEKLSTHVDKVLANAWHLDHGNFYVEDTPEQYFNISEEQLPIYKRWVDLYFDLIEDLYIAREILQKTVISTGDFITYDEAHALLNKLNINGTDIDKLRGRIFSYIGKDEIEDLISVRSITPSYIYIDIDNLDNCVEALAQYKIFQERAIANVLYN